VRARLVGAITLLVAGCTADVTEIVIEVRSDLEVPAELDRVRIDVSRPMQAPTMADAYLADEGLPPLPRTLTIVHRGGSLGPIDVDVHGMSGDTIVVSRRLRLSFDEGRTTRYVVTLSADCVAVDCPADHTCDHGACRSIDVRSCEAEGRACEDAGAVGDAGTADTGTADAGGADACAADEACNGADDDCDGSVDEGIDTTTDPDNCGVCGRVCAAPADHAIGATCEAGSCLLVCERGWGDCNREPADGCETDLDTTMAHCGACGAFCPTSGTFHATDSVCTAGRCLLSCDDDWGDCDMDRSSGCETHVSIDRDHCGTCDNPCPAGQSCRVSMCG